MDKYHEEISFGKADKNTFEFKAENDFVLFHNIYGKKILKYNPQICMANVSYEGLRKYLEGATLGKIPNVEVFLYNGISTHTRKGMWSSAKIEPLSEGELEKFVKEPGLWRFKIKRI